MSSSEPLPVLIPAVPQQRWSCHLCGHCCRTLVEHISQEERDRIASQAWDRELGVEPVVRVGRGWVLNKRPDGACVFLDDQNRCRIHAKYGEDAKPLACRIFPFSVSPVRHGWQASLRFDCPSMASSNGKPVGQYRAWLGDLVTQLDHAVSNDDDAADLQRNLRASVDEIDTVIDRFVRWLKNDNLPFTDRLIGAARITGELSGVTFKTVREQRFGELLELLFKALPGECHARPEPPAPKQRAMLRQLVFAHTEHVSLAEMRSGVIGKLSKRWQQLRTASRFRAGRGSVPVLCGFVASRVAFDAIERVKPKANATGGMEDLIRRYLAARLLSRSAFGKGYYGWPVFSGLAALWISVAATGWLARYAAVSAGRDYFELDDLARAVGVIDRAATRSPSLGTMAERARVAFLLQRDGVARLVAEYTPV